MNGRLRTVPYSEKLPTFRRSLLLLVLVSIALMLRLNSLNYIPESLYNEDGTRFVNQAYEFGLTSIWMPMVGYQFLYPRLVALTARLAPLIAAPYIFFCAWMLCFYSIVWVISIRGAEIGINKLSVLLAILAITFQPSQGEEWFNLQNANFFLGIAFALYICTPLQRASSFAEIFFLILASLTGIFSVIIAAILALQLYVLRDFNVRRSVYISVSAGGVAQFFFVLASHRVQSTGVDLNVIDWLHAVWMLVTFGGAHLEVSIAAVLFWIITAIYFVKWIIDRNSCKSRILWLSPIFAAVTASAMFLVGCVAEGKSLSQLSPINMESRYFLIPYSLTFYVLFTCTQRYRLLQGVQVCLVGLICGFSFLTVNREDGGSTTGLLLHKNMQWSAFAKFQREKPDIVIPINSPWPIYPPLWNVHIKNGANGNNAGEPIKLSPSPLTSGLRDEHQGSNHGNRELKTDIPDSNGFRFDISTSCARNKYIAMEVDAWREQMGFAKIYWGAQGSINARTSLERFYPAGEVTMQFAFRRELTDNAITLYPTLGVPQSSLVRTIDGLKDILGRLSDSPITVAEPTGPGGGVKIREVRLFCLE